MDVRMSDNIVASYETHDLLSTMSKAAKRRLLRMGSIDAGATKLIATRLDAETYFVRRPDETDITVPI